MAQSGLRTGFHRIGVTLALPLLLIAGWLAFAAWRDAQPLPRCVGLFDDIPRRGANARPECWQPAKNTEERGPWETYSGRYTETELYGAKPDYGFAILTAAIGLILYTISRALGWIIAGFRQR